MGGSFDPVHFGHLVAAQDAYEQHDLSRVIMIPAAQAPMKDFGVVASGAHRVAMLQEAVDWDERLEVSDFEVKRGGTSYTVETVRYFNQLHPDDELYWIIGGDQLPKLGRWRGIEELGKMVEFIYLERPGHPTKEHPAIPNLRLHRCDGHLVEISSTELRDRIRRGLSLDYFMPHKAIVYLQNHGLYL